MYTEGLASGVELHAFFFLTNRWLRGPGWRLILTPGFPTEDLRCDNDDEEDFRDLSLDESRDESFDTRDSLSRKLLEKNRVLVVRRVTP